MAEDYTVQQGDCISSIAYENGFFWETLWNDGSNADLKSNRKDPNVLMEGDIVHVPDLTLKQESGATEQRHKFKLKGVPAKLRLKLMRLKTDQSPPGASPSGGGSTSDGVDPDYQPSKNKQEPIANADYIFEVDGVRVKQGKTDQDGRAEIPIVPSACVGRMIFDRGKPTEKIITLDLGGMDPMEEVTGVRKRLRNLGFLCQPDGPATASDLKAALQAFQEQNSLNVTGDADDATKSKLKQIHGS